MTTMTSPIRLTALPALALALSLPPVIGAQEAIEPRATVERDDASRTVIVTIAPFTIPVTGDHHGPGAAGGMSGHDSPFVRHEWPVEGWLYGFSIELYDAEGRRLPRKHLHHVSTVNMSRRQLVYDMFERIAGAGQEQDSFEAPKTIGVPVKPGMEFGTFVGWHNDTGSEITGAKLVLRMKWMPPGMKPRPVDVLPVWLDVNNIPGKSDAYDMPPGVSRKSFEFTVPVGGRILAAGGHLHDYANFIRLEEAESGKEVLTIRPKLDADRKLIEVPRKIYGARGEGIRVRAGRTYRIVAEYDSPLPETVPAGAMGIIALLYRPDDLAQWPALNTEHADTQKDMTNLETMGWSAPAGGHDHDAHQH